MEVEKFRVISCDKSNAEKVEGDFDTLDLAFAYIKKHRDGDNIKMRICRFEYSVSQTRITGGRMTDNNEPAFPELGIIFQLYCSVGPKARQLIIRDENGQDIFIFPLPANHSVSCQIPDAPPFLGGDYEDESEGV